MCLRTFISAVFFISANQIGCDSLSDLTKSGELVVSTVNNPHTHYSDHSGSKGFEYDLAKKFAEALGLELRVIPAKNSSEALRLLDNGEADIAALGEKISSAPNFFQLETQPHTIANLTVVYLAGNSRPRKISDLETLRVSADTQSWPTDLIKSFVGIDFITSTPNASTKVLLDSFQTKTADVAIVNGIEFRLLQKLYPQLKLAFVIEETQIPIGWYVNNTSSGIVLKELANHFIDTASKSGITSSLRSKAFVSLSNFSNGDAYTFDKRIQERLPLYKDSIKQVAKEFNLEWELLAASLAIQLII